MSITPLLDQSSRLGNDLDEEATTINPQELPAWLSCFPEKLKCFARDEAFCRAWQTLGALDREGRFSLARLWNFGSVLFKSDSLLRGNTLVGMRFLAAAGFQVCAGRKISFSSELVRAFWRYALGRLTEERVNVLGRLMCQAPALYLLVEAKMPGNRIPTALRLTDLKGEAVPHKRNPGQLRTALGAPQTAMLNYVHTADEPADVVRELGLLFDEQDRRCFLLDAVERCGAHAEILCHQLLRDSPRSDLELLTALERIRTNLALAESAGCRQYADIHTLLLQVEQGDPRAWPAARSILSEWGICVDSLDDIIIEAWAVQLKRECPTQPFPSCEIRHWDGYGVTAPDGSIPDAPA